jgi:hypothetical protein
MRLQSTFSFEGQYPHFQSQKDPAAELSAEVIAATAQGAKAPKHPAPAPITVLMAALQPV